MTRVRCPICEMPLTCEPARWYCENGHSFDVARQGYVNLLPVSQKHSRQPGDSKLQVAARRAFLGGGHYAPIAEKLCALCAQERPDVLLDVGCGEGYYLGRVQAALPQLECWGVDVSKEAIRCAAAQYKQPRFLTATAAHLPFPDGSFDVITSLFALTLPAEFARVLRPGGALIQVTAGAEHLMGLKSIIYPEIFRREKRADTALPGFRLDAEEMLEFEFTLERSEDVMRLLSMTPHVMRITKEGMARAEAAERLTDRAQVCFRVYHAS